MPKVRAKSVEPPKEIGKVKSEVKVKAKRTESLKIKVSVEKVRRKRMAKDAETEPMEVDEVPKKGTKRPKAIESKETQALKAKEKDARDTEKRQKIDIESSDTSNEKIMEEEGSLSEEENLRSDSNNNNKRVAKKSKRDMDVQPKHDRGIGQPMVCGMGDVGQLGFEAERRKHPAFIPFFEKNNDKAQEIVAGGMHTIVLTDRGHVYSFGCNDDFALGRKTDEEEECVTPVRVNILGIVAQISAGDSHSAALTVDGSVYAWGMFRDMNGPMGLTSESKTKTGQLIPHCMSRNLHTKITKISSGAHHLAMLGEDGTIFTCGSGEQGQLGRVFNPNVRITRAQNDLPKTEREFWLTPQPMTLKSRVKFEDVFCGSFSTYCKSAKCEIYVCGLNNFNQLGIKRAGNEDQHLLITKIVKSPGFKGIKWREIAAGEHHCVALSEDGKVYSLGRQEDGRLGLGDGVDEVSVPTLITGLKNEKCVHIACGLSQGYAINENGSLFSWGFGENCQLGNGTDEDSNVPKKCEGSKVLELKDIQIIQVSGGGQHAAMIGKKKAKTATGAKK